MSCHFKRFSIHKYQSIDFVESPYLEVTQRLEQGDLPMHDYLKIYEFASSLGAFEGYVYGKTRLDEYNMAAMENWSANIIAAYRHLPEGLLGEIQAQCNQTAGRAIRSIEPVLGKDHAITQRIYGLISQETFLPETPDDFNKKKWFADESSTS